MDSDERARTDRDRWSERWAASFEAGNIDERGETRAPSAWVIEHCLALPETMLWCDLACGVGRHALALARAGRRVVALDFVERAVASPVHAARDASLALSGVVADTAALPFCVSSLDGIVCVNYLDRPLFARLRELLRPGGWLIYETYTLAHGALVREGRARAPRDPRFLLEPAELPRLVAPLEVVDAREALVQDETGERHVASIVARRADG